MPFNFLLANPSTGEIAHVGYDETFETNPEAANTDLEIDGFYLYQYSNTEFNDIETHYWDADNYTTVAKSELNLTYSHPHNTVPMFGGTDEINIEGNGGSFVIEVLDESNNVIQIEPENTIDYFPDYDEIVVPLDTQVTISNIPDNVTVYLGHQTQNVVNGEFTFPSYYNEDVILMSKEYLTKRIIVRAG